MLVPAAAVEASPRAAASAAATVSFCGLFIGILNKYIKRTHPSNKNERGLMDGEGCAAAVRQHLDHGAHAVAGRNGGIERPAAERRPDGALLRQLHDHGLDAEAGEPADRASRRRVPDLVRLEPADA